MKLNLFISCAVALAMAIPVAASGCDSSDGRQDARDKVIGIVKNDLKHKEPVITLQPGQPLPTPKGVPVIVDFFATWCGPCKNYAPVFDKVAEEYAGKAVFVRIDVDKFEDLSNQYSIRSIPTTVVIMDGVEVTRRTGSMDYNTLVSIVGNAVSSTAAPATGEVIMLKPGQQLPAPTATKPVVIDFFATWCGPCQQYGPIFERAAKDYAGKAIFVRVDVDECPEISAQYNVTAIPTTVILTTNSQPVIEVGFIDYSQLSGLVNKALK